MWLSFVLFIVALGMLSARGSALLQTLTDEELMKRYQKGQSAAFELLYQRHRKPIFSFILRYVRERDKAEELMQEVFFKLVQQRNNYKTQAKFTTWLYTIARNLCIDTYRKSKHRQTVSLQQNVGGEEDGASLEQLLEDLNPGRDGEQRVFDRQLQRVIEEGVQLLPDEQKQAFLLRQVSHLKFKEIAEIADTSENTIKSRMRYALEFLRRHLEAAGFSLTDLEQN